MWVIIVLLQWTFFVRGWRLTLDSLVLWVFLLLVAIGFLCYFCHIYWIPFLNNKKVLQGNDSIINSTALMTKFSAAVLETTTETSTDMNESATNSYCQDEDGDPDNDVGVDNNQARDWGISNFLTMFGLLFDVQLDQWIDILNAGKYQGFIQAFYKLYVRTTGFSSPSKLTDIWFIGFVAVVDVFGWLCWAVL